MINKVRPEWDDQLRRSVHRIVGRHNVKQITEGRSEFQRTWIVPVSWRSPFLVGRRILPERWPRTKERGASSVAGWDIYGQTHCIVARPGTGTTSPASHQTTGLDEERSPPPSLSPSPRVPVSSLTSLLGPGLGPWGTPKCRQIGFYLVIMDFYHHYPSCLKSLADWTFQHWLCLRKTPKIKCSTSPI